VLIVAYEWRKLVSGGELPFSMPEKSAPATREQLFAFFANLERELEKVEYFRPPDKRDTMLINLRNIFHRMQASRQDIQTLQGVIMAIAEGRKGPARGGVLDGEQAELLRTLLAEHAEGRVPNERAPVRGLARLLRRNPTEAERILWDALTKDRRFAGKSFKRQTPIGRHIADLVSFPLRLVVDLVPDGENEAAARTRVDRREWLLARGYRVVSLPARDVERDVTGTLDRIAEYLS
jgi:tRNA/rRNA methyltransferase